MAAAVRRLAGRHDPEPKGTPVVIASGLAILSAILGFARRARA